MGSEGLAAWLAHGAFWALLAIGWFSGELGARGTAVFLLLWLAGFFGLPYLAYGEALFAPFVALVDIALVFTVCKGDIADR
jgi:hypothetical protein